MKNLILLISVMVIGACATTSTKPVKELTLREKVVGEYEYKEDGDTGRLVLLDNDIFEVYKNGKKVDVEVKWEISKEGEIHATDSKGTIAVYRINKDGSIAVIAVIDDGKREEAHKGDQVTFKKIK